MHDRGVDQREAREKNGENNKVYFYSAKLQHCPKIKTTLKLT